MCFFKYPISFVFTVWALILIVQPASTEPTPFRTLTINLNKAVTEAGYVQKQKQGLLLHPDALIRTNNGTAYGLLNASLHIGFTPPALNKSLIPVLALRPECFCAFKVHIGRVVVELSDRGIKVFRQSVDHKNIDAMFVEIVQDMIPDGKYTELELAIEDQVVMVIVNGDTLASCAINSYDFSLLHFAAFGHPFTIHTVSLKPVFRPAIVVDSIHRSITLDAVFLPSRFNHGNGLQNHHFITWEGGKAAPQALIQTRTPDSVVYDALQGLGLKPGNNLTTDSWKRIGDPSSPEPDKHAEGDKLALFIVYGAKEFPVAQVLTDVQNNAFDFRFAGNRAFIPVWHSGCVVCLQSCPGSKIANRTYTMRDLRKNKSRFKSNTNLPFKEGYPIRVHIKPLL